MLIKQFLLQRSAFHKRPRISYIELPDRINVYQGDGASENLFSYLFAIKAVDQRNES